MNRWLRYGLVAVVAIGLVTATGYVYFVTFSPDRLRYPVRGIDVSHHQGAIDWQRVAADDVAFAILKATEGGDHVDTRFRENLAAAKAAGLAVGAYHFFTLCRPGAEQAANFLANVPVDETLLPPAVDLEYEGNCSARPDADTVRRELEAFLDPVEAAYGKQAILYVTYGFYSAYYKYLPERPLWTRWIVWHPPSDDWLIWQYHDRGRVDGIEGDVDLNVLQGDPERLVELGGSQS
jgi:lysozyme